MNSSSKWTIDQSTASRLVLTQLPEWNDMAARLKLAMPRPPSYVAKSVDDFCPDFDQDGVGILNVVPFSELNNIIQNGDVIVFMEPRTTFTVEQLMKQRGWHAEIAFRNPNGAAMQCGPYGGEREIEECQCTELCTNRHFDATRLNLHIFRIAASAGEYGQIGGLLKGVRLWRHVYHYYNFPPTEDGRWVLDPADFGTLAELEDIARKLILCQEMPEMYCMQWVHAVLSLALNCPLTQSTLARLGVLEVYQQKWADLGFVDEAVEPLGLLPIIPYSPSDHLLALCRLYLGMSVDEARTMLPVLVQQTGVQTALLRLPVRSVPPIVPFSEYRKPAHKGTVTWEYVATTFADSQCKLK